MLGSLARILSISSAERGSVIARCLHRRGFDWAAKACSLPPPAREDSVVLAHRPQDFWKFTPNFFAASLAATARLVVSLIPAMPLSVKLIADVRDHSSSC